MTYAPNFSRGTLPVVTVRKQGKKHWAVHSDGELIEGGFFTREGAHAAAAAHITERDEATRAALAQKEQA